MNLDLMEFILEIIYLIKKRAYVINLDEYSDIGTHWIAFFALNSNSTYFDSLVQNIFQKKLKNLLRDFLLQQTFKEYKHMTQ